MKRIVAIISLVIGIVFTTSCNGEKIDEQQKVDFGDVGSYIELDYKDGEFIPKAEPIKQEQFEAMFQGTWTLDQIGYISRTGKITKIAKSPEDQYPLFGIKDGGKLRQYIEDTATKERTFKDGSYLYNPDNGVLDFVDVVDVHPEFRIVTLKQTEMTGTFKGENNDYDQAILTLYVYKRLSYLDEAGIDQLYGAE